MATSASRPNSAVSPEATAIRGSVQAVVDAKERSIALFGGKAAVISQINELLAECGEVGWDGDDAEQVSDFAVSQAADFVRAIPDGFPLPEVAPEPDGAISLDWIESKQRLFSLSVGETGRLAYAWIDGSDRGHGVARFDGNTVPPRILRGIAEIVEPENACLRVA